MIEKQENTMRSKTKHESVAEEIRQWILSGKISYGEKLPGVREMAKMFSVSTMVISDALDLLSIGQFIERRHGYGIYARLQTAIGKRNIGVIGFFEGEYTTPYFAKLIQISMYPYRRANYNFTIRSITGNNWHNFRLIREELSLMIQCMRLDLLIVHAPMLTEQCLKFLQKQKLPLLFAGDFAKGTFPEYPVNQIIQNQATIAQHMFSSIAAAENPSEITVFETARLGAFHQRLLEKFQVCADQHHVRMNSIIFPADINYLPENQKFSAYRSILKEYSQQILFAPSVNIGLEEEQFISNFRKLFGTLPNLYVMRENQKTIQDVCQFTYQVMEKVIADPKNYYRYEMPIQSSPLIKLSSIQK